MKFYTILLFLCFSVEVMSQYPAGLKSEGKRAPVEYDSVYNVVVLPNDLLSGKYDYVRCSFSAWNKNSVNYYWDSWATDGRYYLIFTPYQMILRTSHENPNPNRIVWVAPITTQQYERLKAKCDFEYKWLEDHKGDEIFDRSYENFSRLLNKINKKMGDLKFEIPSKKVFESTGSVYLNPDLF